MGRSRSYPAKKDSSTSSTETGGTSTVSTVDIKDVGTTSRGLVLVHNASQPRKEQIAAPVTFLVGEAKSEYPTPFEDDPIWPNSDMRGTNVELTHHTGVTSNKVWDAASINESVRACRQKGLAPNAIVVLRYKSGNDWKSRASSHWGIVVSIRTYIPGENPEEYKPLRVQWFNASEHLGRAVEEMFPDDLLVVHPAINDTELRILFEAQKDA